MSSFLDPTHLVNTFGLIGIMVILFAECGLLVGFFLPGDSLLFTAGLLVAGGVFSVPLWVLLVALPLAAIAGNLVGYWIGRRVGPTVFSRPDSRLFKAEYVEKAQGFFDRNGNKTVLLARFVPIVRTFATVMAGVSLMDVRRYVVWSVLGGVLWAAGVTLLGYWLGQVAVVRDHVELFILGVVVLSLVPAVVEVVRGRRSGRPA
ncbi:DedA family protein [Klenkia taihuensis]|uniref:Membrane-associated protein n=1 Tax=Klenkia taihuensis TaxID=1225127 RepID=A0A1I1IHS0_9ACTN|nr:VTT domain-containing protein [Klenkia taihuensis]GHE08627.1 membrane protein [Klenkia taihuensis]SFC35202.1 membrane-associated protein [Klenkia taihuensis]